jgi:fumarate reductase subunit D
MKQTIDSRAHNHPAYWAFLIHRLSGLALALFLPVHFWALGKALSGQAALDGFLHWTDSPLVKLAEWGLVILLSLHLMGGLRLLLVEFGRAPGLRKDWIAIGAGVSLCVALALAFSLTL